MKKAKPRTHHGEIRAEYDFSKGVRGKYARRFAERTHLVKLEPDVAAVFGDSASVNRALRTLTEVARRVSKRAS
jgi:hypothetical protein